MKDLILAVVKNRRWADLDCFALSIVQSGFQGDKVIFHEDVPQDAIDNLNTLGFQTIPIRQYNHLHFQTFRYFPALDFLRSHYQKYRFVYWLDTFGPCVSTRSYACYGAVCISFGGRQRGPVDSKRRHQLRMAEKNAPSCRRIGVSS